MPINFRSLMICLAPVALCGFSALGASRATPAADEAYKEAKTASAALKADESKRKFRHQWLNVAHKFDKVASRWPRSDRAPEALFNSAELYAELSRFSQNGEDLSASEAAYRKLMDQWAGHRLCDDGAFALARLLKDRRNDDEGARKVLEAALEKGGGDRKAELKKLLAQLPEERPPKIAEALRRVGRKDDEPAKSTPKPAEPAPRPPAKLNAEDEEPVAPKSVHARRLPPMRPEGDGEEAEEEGSRAEPRAATVLDGLKLPKLSDLQERLRDVRVGAQPPRVADALARQRLKQVARDEEKAELTLSEQLGLKMRRVVIDAGHGGHDSGAVGPSGVQEKDVTLAIALQVAKKLTAAGLEVLLTRDDDTFVRLEDRAGFANGRKGDLFLSIHCNAAPNRKLRGIETYTLNTSADRYSIRLAARENATSERGVSDLQFILADLATKANTEESSRLAQRVQRSLVKDLGAQHKGVRDLGTKEALFYVLLGARMPAILVETSFLSHPEEEQLLGSEGYQGEVASAISEAVTGFLEEREAKLARVD
jgi:N-acetylmuramoyl-L-alanine amidase